MRKKNIEYILASHQQPKLLSREELNLLKNQTNSLQKQIDALRAERNALGHLSYEDQLDISRLEDNIASLEEKLEMLRVDIATAKLLERHNDETADIGDTVIYQRIRANGTVDEPEETVLINDAAISWDAYGEVSTTSRKSAIGIALYRKAVDAITPTETPADGKITVKVLKIIKAGT